MKRIAFFLLVMFVQTLQLSAATKKVYADFSNLTCYNHAFWDAETQTLSWDEKWSNQIRDLGLPSGDLSEYEKMVIETADLNATSFRVLVYIGETSITYTVDKEGVVELLFDEKLSAADKMNITNIVISGGSSDQTGSVRILSFYLETFDDSVPVKRDPQLSFSPSVVTIQEGEVFVNPTLNNPNDLEVTYSVVSNPDDFATIDSASGDLTLGEGKGRAIVTATFDGNEEFLPGKASYTVIVRSEVEGEIPFVYDVENTGSIYPEPDYPTRSQLPFIEPLTDPFLFSDGSGRALEFEDWSRRRSEISNEIQHYEIGRKPAVSMDDIEASMSGNTLTVKVTVDGKTLTLSSTISYPSSGSAPYPLMIGMNGNGGSLPSAVFSGVNIAHMSFTSSQTNGYSQFDDSGSREFERLYPDLTSNGAYSEWAWGVSRLIDGLQKLGPDVTKIDTEHIGVTGCSYAGKMALFCGAFDERIALTVAQEPGGGGAASWRVSNWLPISVERISNTDYNWFMGSLRDNFNGDNVSYLPYDHHELVAMCCPRACLILGNPSQTWLADPSGYVSCNAARKVWEQYGIEDRFGYSFVGGHDHCNLPSSQYPEVQAFIKRFLGGQEDVETDVSIAPSNYVDSYDYERWIQWWGTDSVPPIYLPGTDDNEVSIWIEAEDMISADNGQNLKIVADENCSNGQYVETNIDATTLSEDKQNWMIGTFTVEEEGDYNLFFHINTSGSFNDDSYYVAFDDATPVLANGFADAGNGWVWVNVSNYASINKHLTAGVHTLNIVGREDGAKLDVVKITTSRMTPDPSELNPTVTSVRSVQPAAALHQNGIYNLHGQRLRSLDGQKGIFIVDGQKQFVR